MLCEQALLSPSSPCYHGSLSDRTDPKAFADFSNTSVQSNLKIFVPAIPAELNSISYDLFMESSCYGECILTSAYM